MKNKKIILTSISIIAVIIILYILINITNINNKNENKNNNYKILTSFYPIYIMTTNITEGAKNIEVSNMAEKLTGCIHDYTLTTSDLKKFEKADIFIQNGGGLENFSQKIIDSYSNVKIISAADNISDFIMNDEGESNSHIWLSINNYIEEVKSIAQKLSKENEKNKEIYNKNAEEYIQKLKLLETKYEELTNLNGKKAICLNESLEYLLKEVGMDETLIETDHEQSSLSAEEIKNIIEKMKSEKINTIFIDKDDTNKTAQTLANETGATIYRLNSEMNGENDRNAYINAMEENYKVLKNLQ